MTDALDLSTIAPPRDTARLRTPDNPEGLRPDGTEYELTSPEDLSLIELQQLIYDSNQMQKLWAGEKMAEPEQKRLERIVNTHVQMLIRGSSEEDVAALSGIAKQKLVLRFLGEVTGAIQMTPTPTSTPNGKESAV